MNRAFGLLLGLALLTGCAHVSSWLDPPPEDLSGLWNEAQDAFFAEDFARAEVLFGEIAREHEGTLEGREALFYLGVIRIDPRNPDWDSELAQARFADYLGLLDDGGTRLYRYPEARTLHQLARQLNLPPEARIEPLRPGERVVTIEDPSASPEQTRALAAEVERLKQLLVERDATIRAQQEELDRIRRTLTGPPNQ
jgi:hypothetical protein